MNRGSLQVAGLLDVVSVHVFDDLINGNVRNVDALGHFCQIVTASHVAIFFKHFNDYRSRFSSFNASAPDQYASAISRAISAVLAVWLQFRNTFVPIPDPKEEMQK